MQFFLHCISNILYLQKYQHIYITIIIIMQMMFLTPINHLHDLNYCTKQDKNNITDKIFDQQYADDIGFNSNNKNIINKTITDIAPMLIYAVCI